MTDGSPPTPSTAQADDATIRQLAEDLESELAAGLPSPAFDRLLALAGDADATVRDRVADVLRQSPGPGVRTWALTLARRSDELPRQVATRVLGAFDDPQVVDRLFHLVHQGAHEVRTLATESLQRIGTEEVVLRALQVLRAGQRKSRHHAGELLMALADELVIPLLIDVVERSEASQSVRTAAAVLCRLGGPEVEIWAHASTGHEKWEVRLAAATMLAANDSPEIRAALWMLAEDEVKDVRGAAVDTLHALGEDVRSWLLERARHDDWAHRLDAAARLPAFRGDDAEAARVVFRLAADAHHDVRKQACRGLRSFSAEVLVPLAAAAVADASHHVRAAACVALGHAGDPDRAPALRHALADGTADVRGEALEALAQCVGANVASDAARLLEDKEWEIRQKAARILRQHPDPSHLSALLRRAGDDDTDVRQDVLRALMGYGDPAAGVTLLMGCIDEDEDVRQTACGLVKGQRERPAIWHLQSAGLDLDAVFPKKGAASEDVAIGFLDTDSIRPVAIAQIDATVALGDWEQRYKSAEILARLQGEEAGDRLVELCKDSDEDVRASAIRGLVERNHPAAAREVVIGMADRHDKVQKEVAGILEGGEERFPEFGPVVAQKAEQYWRRYKDELEEILEWGRKVGHEFLGDAVDVVAMRRGAGQTHYHARGRAIPLIEVNPEPLFESEERGGDVVRGVILHELGHHAYDYRRSGFKSANGVAFSEGVGPIFDILLDERLERKLRSRDAGWGELLDQANAHLREGTPVTVPVADYARALGQPAQDVLEKVRAGELLGTLDESNADAITITIPDWAVLAIVGLLPPLHVFFYAVLVVRDRSMIVDEPVRKAIDLIPANLKDIDHAELAKISVAIGDLLDCRDNGKKAYRKLRAALREHARLLAAMRRRMERARGMCGGIGWEDGQRPPEPHRGPKQRKVVYRRVSIDGRQRGGHGRLYNLGRELSFPPLTHEATLERDHARHNEILKQVRPEVRRLRSHFEQLGRRSRDELASRRGTRLDHARVRDLALWGRPDVLVHSREDPGSGAYIGMLIDRSGSMSGNEIELAKRFGILLAEAARSVPGITGHVNAFDQSTFYRLGDFHRNSIASLTSGGSNNDAGALVRATELALASRRRNRLLIMISDGSPTECSVAALAKLVSMLRRRYAIVCAQVAVAKLEDNAFPHHLDVTRLPMSEAVNRFGRLLVRLSNIWR